MEKKIRTFIQPHCGELNKEMLEILKSRTDLWSEITFNDLINTTFYDVINEKGEYVAFFGNAFWNDEGTGETIICYVFVKEKYRRQGIFKKIIKYTIDHTPLSGTIQIGALFDNKLANDIYSKMFKYDHDFDGGHWYMVKDRRKK